MADALDSLPAIGLPPGMEQEKAAFSLDLMLAHNSGFDSDSGAVAGRIHVLDTVKHGTGPERISPNNDRGMRRAAMGGNGKVKWQPVGDSNPCDKTENLAPTVHKCLHCNEIDNSEISVAPNVAPDSGTDPKLAAVSVVAALRVLGRDAIISVLADLLSGDRE